MLGHLEGIPWQQVEGVPRKECFMALKPTTYAYDTFSGPRSYSSVPLTFPVSTVMEHLNHLWGTTYNVCFLNYYDTQKEALGWHADNSPGMDLDHPIAVVSFGAERYIYVKEKGYKGLVPKENQYLLKHGSVFIMPKGMQRTHLHKIPKHDRECGPRISLTFRHYVPES